MERTTDLVSALLVAVSALAVIGVTSCGGDDRTPAADPPAPTRTPAADPPAPTTPPTTTAPGPRIDGDGVIEFDGQRIAVHCQGEQRTPDQPTVVLLTGFGAPLGVWASFQAELEALGRSCTYDRLGEGASDPPSEATTIATNVALLRAVLDGIGATERVVLVGHSIGGQVAAAYGAAQPEQVAGIVLLDTTPAAYLDDVLALIPEGTTGSAGIIRDEAVLVGSGDNAERLTLDAAPFASLGDTPLVVLPRGLPAIEGLGRFEAPLDERWSAGQQAWADLSTDAVLEVATDSGHNVFLDRPDLVLARLAPLLAAG